MANPTPEPAAAPVQRWPRTCCVYCGKKLTAPPWMACDSHRRLLAFDPMYAADLGEDVQAREGKAS